MTAKPQTDHMRRWVGAGLLLLATLIGGFGTWAARTEISGAIIANGRIGGAADHQVVQHLEGGQVAEVLVAEGDEVSAGQPVIALSAARLQSEINIIETQLFELTARRGRLEAERDAMPAPDFAGALKQRARKQDDIAGLLLGQFRLFEARRRTLTQNITQLSNKAAQVTEQIKGLQAQRNALKQQRELIAQERAAQQSLRERGLTQAGRVLALAREHARLNGQIGEIHATVAQAKGRISEIELQKLQVQSAYREEAITQLRDLQYRELELKERLIALRENYEHFVLRAPVAGVVHGLTVQGAGAVVRPAQTLMSIVPHKPLNTITIKLAPRQIDHIHHGQEVQVQFQGLDARNAPKLSGKITRISADILTDKSSGASYYTADIKLSDAALARLPQPSNLRAGMPVQSFIKTQDRTALAYLIQPFTAYFEKAFREN